MLAPVSSKYLIAYLDYLSQVFQTRLAWYFGEKGNYQKLEDIPAPAALSEDSTFAALSPTFTFEEYIILLIALAPHIQPNFFDQIIQ